VNTRRRAAICTDLLQREDWDLFLTVFSEPHASGHGAWHASWPDHPLYDTIAPRVQGDPMKESYQDCDRALGELLAAVDEDTPVVVFSVHGMGPNTKDVPNGIFLPEQLYRWNFPGKKAIRGKQGHPLPPIYTECGSFPLEVWLTKYDTNPLRRSLLPKVPWGVTSRIEKYLGSGDLGLGDGSDLISPFELRRETDVVPWIGAHWYRPLWPRMKAFCVPSFSDGCVRINVRGRDGSGVVAPEDYLRTCDEVAAMLQTMRDCRHGLQMVKKVIRMREDPFDDDPNLPSADLIVVWQEEYAADSVETPGYGRIGPVPHYRAGSHLSTGFAAIRHPLVAAGSTMPAGNVMDLAPTLLTMMGAPLQPHFGGTSLIPGGVTSAS
jgi:predicted AlkP superfamily phosphohydrolase/phosphomutase